MSFVEDLFRTFPTTAPAGQLSADPANRLPAETVTEWPYVLPKPFSLNLALKTFCEPTPGEKAAASEAVTFKHAVPDNRVVRVRFCPRKTFASLASAQNSSDLGWPAAMRWKIDPAKLADVTIRSPMPDLPRAAHRVYGRVLWINGDAPPALALKLAAKKFPDLPKERPISLQTLGVVPPAATVFDCRTPLSPFDLYEIAPGDLVYCPGDLPAWLVGTWQTDPLTGKGKTVGGLNPVGLTYSLLGNGFWRVGAKPGLWQFFPGTPPENGKQRLKGWRFPDWMALRDPFAPGVARPNHGGFEFLSLHEAARQRIIKTEHTHFCYTHCKWTYAGKHWLTPEAVRDGWELAPTGHGIHFNELLAKGHENYLFALAGLADLGDEFRIREGSEVQLNIRHFLYHRLGYAGVGELLGEWLRAHEAHEETLRGDTPRLSPKHIRLNRQEILAQLHDAAFMGMADHKDIANRKVRNATFELGDSDAPINGRRRFRKYHEGSPIARGRFTRPQVDDDPSPWLTFSACRNERLIEGNDSDMPTQTSVREEEDRIDKKSDRRRVESYLPEGYVRYADDQDWTPVVPEQAPLLRRILQRSKRDNDGVGLLGFKCAYKDDTTFHRKPTTWTVTGLGLTGEEITRDITTYSFKEGEYLTSREYYKLTPDRRVGWIRRPKGTYVTLYFAGYVKEEFMPDGTASDKTPTKKERDRAAEKGMAAPTRVVRRHMCWSEGKQKWFAPFRTPDPVLDETGKQKTDAAGQPLFRWFVARPEPFNRPSWRMLVRSLTELETIRHQLAEERWDRLAFDPSEALLGFAGGELQVTLTPGEDHRFFQVDWYDPADEKSLTDQARAEAVRRIHAQIDGMVERVTAMGGLEQDALVKFSQLALDTKLFTIQSVHGLREDHPETYTPPTKTVPLYRAVDPTWERQKLALTQLGQAYAQARQAAGDTSVREKLARLVEQTKARWERALEARKGKPLARRTPIREQVAWMVERVEPKAAPVPAGPAVFETFKPARHEDPEKCYDRKMAYAEDLDPAADEEALTYHADLATVRWTRLARRYKGLLNRRAKGQAYALVWKITQQGLERQYSQARLARRKRRWVVKVS